jgi:tRNA pseudouridine32 synthase/23S rRNA pseudouridine746 synthase
MATSGLLLIAKTMSTYHNLQSQFINRSIQKRYIALLDGIVENDEGIIDLPVRVDLEDRPRQLVCFEHGKKAITKFEVIERKDNKTLIYFYPITGRTHQLRVHAAHNLGLNTPIVGDELYGKHSTRLYLHAERLEFEHPIYKKRLKFKSEHRFT